MVLSITDESATQRLSFFFFFQRPFHFLLGNSKTKLSTRGKKTTVFNPALLFLRRLCVFQRPLSFFSRTPHALPFFFFQSESKSCFLCLFFFSSFFFLNCRHLNDNNVGKKKKVAYVLPAFAHAFLFLLFHPLLLLFFDLLLLRNVDICANLFLPRCFNA